MSINVCVFSGNLGGDAEQKYTPNGACIANFSLPVKQGYGDHEKTSWVRCILLGKKAESLPQYLRKGSKVTVTGEFVLNEWTDQQGQKRSTPELIVRDLELPPRQDGQQYSQQQQPAYQQQPQQNQYAAMQGGQQPVQQQQQMSSNNPYQQQQPAMRGAQNMAGSGNPDDQIPF